ncbi:glycosyltransferase [Serratia marcescens]|uniref:glycosyltransferase n=2 Tax=Serratia marcescens TaxID=615 RepID=UPI0039896D21
MKILHAAETIKGGVATVMRLIASDHVNNPKVSEVYCLVPENQKDEVKHLPASAVLTFERTGRNFSSFVSFISHFVKNICHVKPDIIHLHSTFAGVLGRLILIVMYPIYRPKVIYCPHAFSFLMEGGQLKKFFYRTVERVLLPITDAVICVSVYEKNAAIANGLKEEKLHVVYNGVPAPTSIDSLKNPYQIPGVINLLFVGRLDYQKGFDILIKMMSNLDSKPYHLTIIGGAVHGDNLYAKLPQTTYTGWLSSDEISPYFAYADVLIIPSRWEGFAMVPLEAMSYGTPVISSNCTSFPEMIFPGVNGELFDLAHHEKLSSIVVSKTKEEWATMGKRAESIFLENFKVDKMVEQTMNVYKHVLK